MEVATQEVLTAPSSPTEIPTAPSSPTETRTAPSSPTENQHHLKIRKVEEVVPIIIDENNYLLIGKIILHDLDRPYNGVIIIINGIYHIYYQSSGECGLWRYYCSKIINPKKSDVQIQMFKGTNYTESTCIHPILQKYIFENYNKLAYISNHEEIGLKRQDKIGYYKHCTLVSHITHINNTNRNENPLFLGDARCNANFDKKELENYIKNPRPYVDRYNFAFNTEYQLLSDTIEEICNYEFTMEKLPCLCLMYKILLQHKINGITVELYFLKIEFLDIDGMNFVDGIHFLEIMPFLNGIHIMPFLIIPNNTKIDNFGLPETFFNAGVFTGKLIDYKGQCSDAEQINEIKTNPNYCYIGDRFIEMELIQKLMELFEPTDMVIGEPIGKGILNQSQYKSIFNSTKDSNFQRRKLYQQKIKNRTKKYAVKRTKKQKNKQKKTKKHTKPK